MQSCMLIFNATANVLEHIRDLDRNYDLHRVCNRFLLITIALSLASIARVIKGPFAGNIDQIHGYSLFDIGARFVRSSSVQKGDFAERIAVFADQIRKGKKVFRDPDGSTNITLRVRNRLSQGPLHDVIRCWREEFFDPVYTQSAPGMDIGAFFAYSLCSLGQNYRLTASRN